MDEQRFLTDHPGNAGLQARREKAKMKLQKCGCCQSEVDTLTAERDALQAIITATLKEVPVGNITKHGPQFLAEDMRYWVSEAAKLSNENEQLQAIVAQCQGSIIVEADISAYEFEPADCNGGVLLEGVFYHSVEEAKAALAAQKGPTP